MTLLLLIFGGVIYLLLAAGVYASARSADGALPPLSRLASAALGLGWPLVLVVGIVLAFQEKAARR